MKYELSNYHECSGIYRAPKTSQPNMNTQSKQFVIAATDRCGDIILLNDGAWMSEKSIRHKDKSSFLYVPRVFPSKAAARQFINKAFSGSPYGIKGRFKTREWQPDQLT